MASSFERPIAEARIVISIPNFLFHLLSWIPFVGGAFNRSSFELMHTDQFVIVPIGRLVDALLRLLLLASVLVGGIFGYQHFFTTEPEPLTQQQLLQTFDLDEEQFQEVLAENKGEQFMPVIDLAKDDPAANDDLRMRRFNNRILAAAKIAKSRLTQQKFFGLTKELELRTERAFFNLEKNVFDSESNDSLAALGKLYKSVQFETQTKEADALNDRARLGEIVANTIQFVEVDDVEKDAFIGEQLLKSTEQISEQFLTGGEIGTKLSRLSALARTRLSSLGKSTKFCDQLDDLLTRMASANANSRIKDLADMDCRSTFAQTLNYLPDDNASFDDKFVAEFFDKFRQVLEVGSISVEDHKMIVTKLNEIAESGWPLEAREMLENLNSKFPAEVDQADLQKQIGKLEARLNWVGRDFSLKGIQTLANHEPKFSKRHTLATFVVYISMPTIREAETRIKQFGRVYNNLYKKAKLDFLVVYLHEDDKQNGLQAMRVMDDRMKPVDYWQLNVNSENGRAFFEEQINFDETPFAVVLDRDRRVVALNPNPERVTKLLDNLRARDFTK